MDRLYKNIFADRGPNKRKVKPKAIDDMDLNEESSEDEEFVSKDSISSEDGSNEDSDDSNEGSDDSLDSQPSIESLKETKIIQLSKKFNLDIHSHDFLSKLNALQFEWKQKQPVVCCICLENDTEEDDLLVFCESVDCSVSVHQKCYGIPVLPKEEDPWFCDRCCSKNSSVGCLLCLSDSGALKKFAADADQYFHVVCVLWMRGTHIEDTVTMTGLDLGSITYSSFGNSFSQCDFCSSQVGTLVRCDAGGCKKSMHATCGLRYDLLESFADDSDDWVIYCKSHTSHIDPKLHKWAKWDDINEDYKTLKYYWEKLQNDSKLQWKHRQKQLNQRILVHQRNILRNMAEKRFLEEIENVHNKEINIKNIQLREFEINRRNELENRLSIITSCLTNIRNLLDNQIDWKYLVKGYTLPIIPENGLEFFLRLGTLLEANEDYMKIKQPEPVIDSSLSKKRRRLSQSETSASIESLDKKTVSTPMCAVCNSIAAPCTGPASRRSSTNRTLNSTVIRMMICQSCDKRFHFECLDPPITKRFPRGWAWKCEFCVEEEEEEED